MDKKLILLMVAAVCIALYFYGSQLKRDNEFFKQLPTIGGVAFGLNTLINLTQS